MTIDIHTHLGKIHRGQSYLGPEDLIEWMDKNEIEKCVVLPLENPEENHYYVLTKDILEIAHRFPQRIIPFCNVDPRIWVRGTDPYWHPETDLKDIVEDYVKEGAKGFGEILAGLYIDDPRLKNIFRVCGELKIPVLLHLDAMRCIDELHFPRFKKVLSEFRNTIFIAHGPHWWGEMSEDADEKCLQIHPTGRIKGRGMTIKILEDYPNIYGDLSANSGYNALTRDPEFGFRFLEEHSDKLLFGTDYLSPGQETPIVEYLKNAPIENKKKQDILGNNAKRLLRLN
jgi:predicted TIM-barrel fold metal-dependent hydrolase